jgi:site-specific recombinase XerD
MRRCLDRIARIVVAGNPAPGTTLADLGHPADGANRTWWALRYKDTAYVRKELLVHQPPLPPSTFNQHMSALRQVLRQCWLLGLMSGDDYEHAIAVPNLKGHREPAGRAIHQDELTALMKACLADAGTQGPIALRDAALLAVLQSTGMRRDEAAAALIQRYDPRERALKVIGKGNKERVVFIHPDAVPHLDRWLVTLGERSGPIFRPVDRWHNIGAGRMSARAIGRRVDVRRQEAGLFSLATHDFRRTFAGDFLDAGGDLAALQSLLGHASATTTAGYDRRPGRQARAVVDRIHLRHPENLTPSERED